MQVMQNAGRTNYGKTGMELQGLAERLLGFVRGRRGTRQGQERLMRVVETLPLGGKRQLMLVSCGGEHFLVGGGLESVQAIVRVKGEYPVEGQGEACLS